MPPEMTYGALAPAVPHVSRIVLGAGGLGSLADAELARLLDAAFELGVRAFDTAPFYGEGKTESRIGAWIEERGVRADIVLIAKGAHPGRTGSRVSPAGIGEDIERSRVSMGAEHLDVFLVHRDAPEVPVEVVVDCLDEHVRAGRVRAVGVSNWSANRIRAANAYAERAGRTRLTVTSPQLSLALPVKLPWPGCISYGGCQGEADRTASREGKLAVMAWAPLGSGAVAGAPPPGLSAYRERLGTAAATYGTRDNFERLARAFELGEKKGLSAAQIALAWLFHQKLDLFAIVGSKRPEGFRQAVDALRVVLSDDEVAWLWDGTSPEERERRSLPAAVLRARIWDAVIVGGGPTGTWTAKVLTGAGMKVMLLEAGPERDVLDTDPQDAHALARRVEQGPRQMIQRRHGRWYGMPSQLFVDDVEQPYGVPASHPFTWIRARQLGGRGLLWFGHTLRMSDHELHAARLDGCEEPWPLSYAELAPFYDEVERTMGVRGSTEGVPVLPDGRYMGPNPLAPANEVVRALIEHRWPERRVMPLRSIGFDHCDENGWWWGSALPVLAMARSTGLLDVRLDTVVRQVLLEPGTGRARGVACVDRTTRAEIEIRARVVVLAASALESTRLLLASATSEHPAGLGGSSGCLGRYLVDHPSMSFAGRVRRSPPLPAGPGTARAFLIPRFRNVDRVEMGFSRGYGVTGSMAPGGPDAPFHFNVCAELLPRRDNRVTLLPDHVDAWGVPIPYVTCTYGENERRMAQDARQFVAELGDLVGLEFTSRSTELAPPGTFVHEVGGARMGRDPRTSVLDPFHRVWDVDNLYVVDGAAWPSAGWQNPTLTLMALAVRAAEGIAARTRRGELGS